MLFIQQNAIVSKAMDEAATEVQAGKYNSIQEVQAALRQKTQPAMQALDCGTHAYESGPMAVARTLVFRQTSSMTRQKRGPQRNVPGGAAQLAEVETSVPATLARHALP